MSARRMIHSELEATICLSGSTKLDSRASQDPFQFRISPFQANQESQYLAAFILAYRLVTIV